MNLRRLAAGVAGLAGVFLLASPAQAHPLGNFTTNQYAGLRIAPSGVDVDYVLDLAELPAYQAKTDDIDADHDGTFSAGETSAYATRTCAAVAAADTVTVDARTVAFSARPGRVSFPPGAGGLTTLRLECVLHAGAELTARSTVTFRNGMFADRIGWREITAVGDRSTIVDSDVPSAGVSALLTAYPPGVAGLDVRTASVTVRPGGPAAAPAPFLAGGGSQARDVDRFTVWFTGLVGHPHLTLGVGVLAFLIALVLGGAHAVAPGHGKTIMAAYLVGSRGRLSQALTVAGTVAATHTAGVLVLGVLLATSLQLAPDLMYAWLRLVSGVLVALVGAHLLRRAVRRGRAGPVALPHEHVRHAEPGEPVLPPGHTHSHAGDDPHDHVHPHGSAHTPHVHADAHDHSHPHHEDAHDHPAHALAHDHPAHALAHDHPAHALAHDHPVHAVAHDHHDHAGVHGPDHAHADHELVVAGGGHGALPATRQTQAAPHAEPHTHTHGGRPHTHYLPAPDEALNPRTLLAMGFAGGLSPSPSAVVVLLGAAALGRAWYGVLLVAAYGIGLAATLIGIGFVLARWGERLRGVGSHRFQRLLTHRLPAATATIILLVGVGMVALATASLLA